jgi:hypothetical protein
MSFVASDNGTPRFRAINLWPPGSPLPLALGAILYHPRRAPKLIRQPPDYNLTGASRLETTRRHHSDTPILHFSFFQS